MCGGAMHGREPALRVLVVEDEMMIALLLQNMLLRCGYTVVGPVARLEKALEVAQHEAEDLAILDVNLDGRDVYPVADALSARGIPFIFATGHGRGGLRAPYREYPTLQKAYREDDLRAAIAEAKSQRA
jgi:CheY-like chemotaxis protein